VRTGLAAGGHELKARRKVTPMLRFHNVVPMDVTARAARSLQVDTEESLREVLQVSSQREDARARMLNPTKVWVPEIDRTERRV